MWGCYVSIFKDLFPADSVGAIIDATISFRRESDPDKIRTYLDPDLLPNVVKWKRTEFNRQIFKFVNLRFGRNEDEVMDYTEYLKSLEENNNKCQGKKW